MTRYSVAEAKNTLPKLLDKVLAGEAVTITRRGVAIVELKPTRSVQQGAVIDLAWLDTNRPKALKPNDLGDAVGEMRDEYR